MNIDGKGNDVKEKNTTKNCLEEDVSTTIPQHEIESLARCLLPEIQKFFESAEGKREFEEWTFKRQKNGK